MPGDHALSEAQVCLVVDTLHEGCDAVRNVAPQTNSYVVLRNGGQGMIENEQGIAAGVGGALRSARQRCGKSQRAIATVARTTAATVSRVERGDPRVAIASICRTAWSLGIDCRVTFSQHTPDTASAVVAVAVADLATFAEVFADLDNPDIMNRAWR